MATSGLEERIGRVIADLREETTVPGQHGAPCPLQQRMAQTGTPAVSVGVIDNFGVAWARGFGTLASGAEPAAANTPFQCGSVSKPVFALAVMKLAEIGTIDLDADVNDYLTRYCVLDRHPHGRSARCDGGVELVVFSAVVLGSNRYPRDLASPPLIFEARVPLERYVNNYAAFF